MSSRPAWQTGFLSLYGWFCHFSSDSSFLQFVPDYAYCNPGSSIGDVWFMILDGAEGLSECRVEHHTFLHPRVRALTPTLWVPLHSHTEYPPTSIGLYPVRGCVRGCYPFTHWMFAFLVLNYKSFLPHFDFCLLMLTKNRSYHFQ
jgi:hypothetical protein